MAIGSSKKLLGSHIKWEKNHRNFKASLFSTVRKMINPFSCSPQQQNSISPPIIANNSSIFIFYKGF